MNVLFDWLLVGSPTLRPSDALYSFGAPGLVRPVAINLMPVWRC